MQPFTPSRPAHPVARLRPWIVGAALLLGSAAWAVTPAQFRDAYQQFAQATSGHSAAIEPAAQAFVALVQREPANPVLHAYAGSATALKATTTVLPWKKLAFAEEGLAQLDKALALLVPAHTTPSHNGIASMLEVKFVAANTFLGVPSFMNRHDRGSKLLGDVVSSPLLVSAPLGFRGAVWLKAAKEATKAKNAADARHYLDLIVQQQAPQAAQAQALLKELAS